MKGSPVIATAITIVVLLGIYLGIRAVILPESPNDHSADSHAGHGHDHPHGGHGHDHGGHDHHGHGHHDHGSEGHDDSALDTEFEMYFSSTPQSVKITQPSSEKEVLHITEFDSPEWSGSGVLNLESHEVELQVDVTWASPSAMNFVQIVVSPNGHATREKTLRNEDNISDIADFHW